MEIHIHEEQGETYMGGQLYSLFVNGDGSANDNGREEAGLCLHEVLDYIAACLSQEAETVVEPQVCKHCFPE